MNWSSELQRPLFFCVSFISSIILEVDERGEKGETHCIKKHSVPSSGRKERTLPLLFFCAVSQQFELHSRSDHSIVWDFMKKTYKLFKAIHSFSGTTPYQQLPAQLVWSQSRIPPMLRLVRGLADVAVRSRVRVVARRAYIVAVFVE
jgi:hypothetical protein